MSDLLSLAQLTKATERMFVRTGDAYRLATKIQLLIEEKSFQAGVFVSLSKTAQPPRSELARFSRSSAGVEGEGVPPAMQQGGSHGLF
jgi:hypothetical protein